MTDIQKQFNDKRRLLLNLLDSPVIDVRHIGSTALGEEGIMDILVIVPNLHAMTTLDEKRLNQSGFYRLHHPYHKKCVFSEFHDLVSLREKCRLHIVEDQSTKTRIYLEAQNTLTESETLAEAFRTFKESVRHLSQKDYESAKADWFRLHIANKH
ncbi:GrpB family protein [Macrococcus brunensis]|uniref:GrpB family protein n=1 Tax=Macrococcus brunensis TaxID=198483 RepID=UPI001EF06622|nr:GrpB family protein [Macrococcus brunensis]ULG72523.1 GrpB family protein [Macrococcus brunensis]